MFPGAGFRVGAGLGAEAWPMLMVPLVRLKSISLRAHIQLP